MSIPPAASRASRKGEIGWMTVEEALEWAYRDELPKAAAGRGGSLVPYGRLGYGSALPATMAVATWSTIPDNVFGVVPVEGDAGEPHPDALVIHEAVQSLAALEVEADFAAVPPELAAFGSDAVMAVARAVDAETVSDGGARHMRLALPEIMRAASILGAPDGAIDPATVLVPETVGGRVAWFRRDVIACEGGSYEVELDGFDAKRRRPYPDAYRKMRLEPDPLPALTARLRYEVWRAALDVLFELLAGRLSAVRLKPSAMPQAPWEQAPPVIRRARAPAG